MIAIVLSSARPTRAVSVKDCVLLRSPSSFKTAIRSFLKHYSRPVAHASFRIGCQFLVTEPFRVYFRAGADQQRDDFWIVPFVRDRKSTRLNSSHMSISYAVFCLKKKIHEQ